MHGDQPPSNDTGRFEWNTATEALGFPDPGSELAFAVFADGAYDQLGLMDIAALLDLTDKIVRRCDSELGFKVLPRRWVVERTFGWMTRWRRLVRDYEQRLDVSTAMILIAIAAILLRRNAHP